MRENGARLNIFSATKGGGGGGRRERGAFSAFMVFLFFFKGKPKGAFFLTGESNKETERHTSSVHTVRVFEKTRNVITFF